jgi:hypothetical protein
MEFQAIGAEPLLEMGRKWSPFLRKAKKIDQFWWFVEMINQQNRSPRIRSDCHHVTLNKS